MAKTKDNSREAKIKLVFASYPEAKSFHFTSDSNAFSLESDAKNHAKNLGDKEVVEITRAMAKSGILKQVQDDTTLKQVQGDDAKGGAKNEFQAQGTVREVNLTGESGEGVPYGTDDQGRTVSDIATDVAEKMEAAKDRATEDSVTDSSDAAEAAEKEAESVQAPEAPKQVRGDVQDDAPAKAAPAKKSSSTKKGGK